MIAHGVYMIWDVQAESFGTLFSQPNNAVAQRSFAALVKDPASFVSKCPEDFVLFRVGEVDLDSGQIVPEVPLRRLISGDQVLGR